MSKQIESVDVLIIGAGLSGIGSLSVAPSVPQPQLYDS